MSSDLIDIRLSNEYTLEIRDELVEVCTVQSYSSLAAKVH